MKNKSKLNSVIICIFLCSIIVGCAAKATKLNTEICFTKAELGMSAEEIMEVEGEPTEQYEGQLIYNKKLYGYDVSIFYLNIWPYPEDGTFRTKGIYMYLQNNDDNLKSVVLKKDKFIKSMYKELRKQYGEPYREDYFKTGDVGYKAYNYIWQLTDELEICLTSSGGVMAVDPQDR